MFEWIARKGRIDSDIPDVEVEEQARWTYFDIFNIDPIQRPLPRQRDPPGPHGVQAGRAALRE
eukprot:2012250-Lingulodinium_polyedra.AAC.1